MEPPDLSKSNANNTITSPVVHTGFFSTTTPTASTAAHPPVFPLLQRYFMRRKPTIPLHTAEQKTELPTKLNALKVLLDDIYPPDVPEHTSQRTQ